MEKEIAAMHDPKEMPDDYNIQETMDIFKQLMDKKIDVSGLLNQRYGFFSSVAGLASSLNEICSGLASLELNDTNLSNQILPP